MKVVIAPDSFKESLTALDVANSIEKGLKDIIPTVECVKIPMADGGEGTVQAIIDATGGTLHHKVVSDPLGRKVNAFWGLSGNKKTAIIEMAAASGVHLVPLNERNPLITSSYGTGELILDALNHNVDHIILGIGGSATNDAGCGLLQALGVQLLDHSGHDISSGGGAISTLARIDLTTLDPRLHHITFDIACDVHNPFYGSNGASVVFGPQKGATEHMVAQLDANLRYFAQLVLKTTNIDIQSIAGAGAAGGVGGCLVGLCGAQLTSGVDTVINAVNLLDVIKDADLVMTGEGRIDHQTIYGKTPIGVARVAKQYGIPVIAIAGGLSADCDIVRQFGIDSVFSITPRVMDLQTALDETQNNIRMCVRNIAALIQMQL